MVFNLVTCQYCGVTYPVLDDTSSSNICLDCIKKLLMEEEELEWQALLAGHSCPTGRCDS